LNDHIELCRCRQSRRCSVAGGSSAQSIEAEHPGWL